MLIPTIEEVNAYISSRLPLHNPLRAIWSVSEKQVYLNQSVDEFNFIYHMFNAGTDWEKVKDAICQNVLGVIDLEFSSTAEQQHKVMQSMGQAKNTKYNRREQGELGLGGLAGDVKKETKYLSSKRAWNMVKEYTYGSYDLC